MGLSRPEHTVFDVGGTCCRLTRGRDRPTVHPPLGATGGVISFFFIPIPDYETIKLPALKALSDGRARPIRELFEELAKVFKITPEERAELLPSGTQQRWKNRVNWACYDLYKANILQRPRKGIYQITDFEGCWPCINHKDRKSTRL